MKILAIDPSVNNVGMAFYSTEEKKLRTNLFHPKRTRTTHIINIGIQITLEIHKWFKIISKELVQNVDMTIIEFPNWQESTRGLIAMQQGYTLDLAYLCGAVVGGLELNMSDCMLPTPLQWKKNIPKAATQRRVEKQFGVLNCSEHEYDAVGMIQWYLNLSGNKF